MSFSKEYANTFFGIQEACRSCKVVCSRLDDPGGELNILEELYFEIHRADMIIADISGLNPNVLYEVGYAHGLNKPIFLLTDNVKELPFNLSPLRHIVFDKNDLPGLSKKLVTALKNHINKLKFLPGQDSGSLTPRTEERPLAVTGWNKWGGISVFTDENTKMLEGKAATAGYKTEHLDPELSGKRLILYVRGTGKSNFSMKRLLKMTVNKDDSLLKPRDPSGLISGEYLYAADGRVEFILPANFDGTLGLVFYEAELKSLRISLFVK
jgi:hypothetical protein